MKAVVNGISVEGTPKEILEFMQGTANPQEEKITDVDQKKEPIVILDISWPIPPKKTRKPTWPRDPNKNGRRCKGYVEVPATQRRKWKALSIYQVDNLGLETFVMDCESQREAGEVTNISEFAICWAVANNKQTHNPEGEAYKFYRI